jgi:hypothetical protein
VQAPVEIWYAGVVVGRAERIEPAEDKDAGPDRFFVPLPEPLPVGTVVDLAGADATTRARVLRVRESADAGGAGMTVVLVQGDAAAAAASPAALAASPPPAVETGGIPEALSSEGESQATDLGAAGEPGSAADANGAAKKKRRRRR